MDMSIGDQSRQPLIPQAEVARNVERMIEACVLFSKGAIGLEQLWYRMRGDRRSLSIQQVQDRLLGYLLYQLHMDFICWRGARDDIIRRSALQVAAAVCTARSH